MEQEFSTKDLYQSAALVASGIRLLRIDRAGWRQVEFVFPANDATERVNNEFINGLLELNVQTYLATWRQLRRQIDKQMGDMGDGSQRTTRR